MQTTQVFEEYISSNSEELNNITPLRSPKSIKPRKSISVVSSSESDNSKKGKNIKKIKNKKAIPSHLIRLKSAFKKLPTKKSSDMSFGKRTIHTTGDNEEEYPADLIIDVEQDIVEQGRRTRENMIGNYVWLVTQWQTACGWGAEENEVKDALAKLKVWLERTFFKTVIEAKKLKEATRSGGTIPIKAGDTLICTIVRGIDKISVYTDLDNNEMTFNVFLACLTLYILEIGFKYDNEWLLRFGSAPLGVIAYKKKDGWVKANAGIHGHSGLPLIANFKLNVEKGDDVELKKLAKWIPSLADLAFWCNAIDIKRTSPGAVGVNSNMLESFAQTTGISEEDFKTIFKDFKATDWVVNNPVKAARSMAIKFRTVLNKHKASTSNPDKKNDGNEGDPDI